MLSFIPTPIGNLLDITIHTLHAFNRSDVVLCEDTRVSKRLLTLLYQNPIIQQHFPNIATKERKFISFHSHNQNEVLSRITPDFFQQNVVFCTDAGMPNISDPGALLLQYVREHNVEYEVLLGGSAFSHAFVCSGLEGGFCFMGFLPHKQMHRQITLKSYLQLHKDLHLICYESPKRLRESLLDIQAIMPHANLFVYKELTKMYQTEMIGNATKILEGLPTNILGEYCIVIEKSFNIPEPTTKTLCLTQQDILELDIPPKQKAKMLAQITTQSIKQWYQTLIR